jgi:hypothetical protein
MLACIGKTQSVTKRRLNWFRRLRELDEMCDMIKCIGLAWWVHWDCANVIELQKLWEKYANQEKKEKNKEKMRKNSCEELTCNIKCTNTKKSEIYDL